MVPEEGVEPTRPCGHRILSPARLPVPPFGQQLKIARLRPALKISTGPRLDLLTAAGLPYNPVRQGSPPARRSNGSEAVDGYRYYTFLRGSPRVPWPILLDGPGSGGTEKFA